MKVVIVSCLEDDSISISQSIANFSIYMLENCVKVKDLKIYGRAEYAKGKNLFRFLNGIFNNNHGELIVLYYSGHGKPEGWRLKSDWTVPYEKLFNIFKKHRGHFIFINDCCFAMAVKKYQRLLKNKNLILGLAPENLKGFCSVVYYILNDWINRRLSNPIYIDEDEKKIRRYKLRSGARLDYLCYPKDG